MAVAFSYVPMCEGTDVMISKEVVRFRVCVTEVFYGELCCNCYRMT